MNDVSHSTARARRRAPGAPRWFLMAALLAAGCGGGDEPRLATATAPPSLDTTTSLPASTTTTVPATTTTVPVATTAAPAPVPAAASGAALATKAKAAIFQQGDFPVGWKPVPEGEGGLNIEVLWGELTRCLGVAPTPATAVATSPTYQRALVQARSTVEYTSDAAATAIATALAGPKFPACAKEAFTADVNRSKPEGGVPGPVQVVPLDLPGKAPKTSASRITVTITLGEVQVPLFQDFVVLFKGGVVIRTFFLNPGAVFPVDLERSLLDKVVSRA